MFLANPELEDEIKAVVVKDKEDEEEEFVTSPTKAPPAQFSFSPSPLSPIRP